MTVNKPAECSWPLVPLQAEARALLTGVKLLLWSGCENSQKAGRGCPRVVPERYSDEQRRIL